MSAGRPSSILILGVGTAGWMAANLFQHRWGKLGTRVALIESSDIGIVGRSGDKYVVYVGGRALGDRLNFELRDLTPRGEIVATLVPLLRRWREERQTGEGFGDFCARIGPEAARAALAKQA